MHRPPLPRRGVGAPHQCPLGSVASYFIDADVRLHILVTHRNHRYLWDLDHGFAGVVLIKKIGDGSKEVKGCWDSIHVVEVKEHSKSRTAGKDTYKLTSTVMLWLETNKDGSGMMQLGGSLTRQDEREMQYDESAHPHIANIGLMIEEMENKMRSTLNQIYFGKTKDIVNDLRSVESLSDGMGKRMMSMKIADALKARGSRP